MPGPAFRDGEDLERVADRDERIAVEHDKVCELPFLERAQLLLESEGELVFKIDVGSRSPHGAELEGLFTVPSQRRRGHATLTLGQISRHLLSSLPRLTLRIDDHATSLAGVARKVGFVPGRAQKLVLAE